MNGSSGRHRFVALVVAAAIAAPVGCGSSNSKEGHDAATTERTTLFDESGPFRVWERRVGSGGGSDPAFVVWSPIADDDSTSLPSGAPFPLVVFAHGLALGPDDYSEMLTHQASWGFVVVAPEHVDGVDLFDVAETLRAAPTSPLAGVTMPEGPIVVEGHSNGTIRAVATANDHGSSIAGVLLLAGGGAVDDRLGAGAPGFFLAGGRDPSTETWVRPAFRDARGMVRLVVVEDAGHLSFSDVCSAERNPTVGPEACASPEIGDETVTRVVNHATVGFLRWAFGIDEDGDALTEGLAGFGVDLAIE